MTIWFYILWIIVVVKVLLSPFGKLTKKSVFFACLLVSLWLTVGVVVYLTRTQEFDRKEKDILTQRSVLETKEMKLVALEKDHPTSRDVLLELASLSYQLGDMENFKNYLHRVQKIDPNNQLVLSLSKLESE